ncbi:hypothetical protein [Aeromonas enteropelogenes]|uniref:hypothetical protein n=1 Tax=Aeromonas enteropelogenes TaxID=29489 RepID=UPI003BA35713
MTQERSFNFIYDTLVSDKNDIAGIIAYSVYKRQKIEFIDNFRNNNGHAPDDEELSKFTEISTSPSQIEFYKSEAVTLTETFLEAVLNDDLREREELFSTRVRNELMNIKPNHLLDILKGAIGSFLFVLLTGLLYFSVWSLSVSPKAIIEQVFQVTIEPKQTTGEAGTSPKP